MKGKIDKGKRSKKKSAVTLIKKKQLKTIQPANTIDFKSHWIPYLQGLVSYMFSDESVKLETCMYVRSKWINKSEKKNKSIRGPTGTTSLDHNEFGSNRNEGGNFIDKELDSQPQG